MAETITDFLARVGFEPYASVANSWDSFDPSGQVLMHLWVEPNQRVRDHHLTEAYLRVRCFFAHRYLQHAKTKAVGYAGRFKAIRALQSGARGWVALSNAPEEKRGPGVWAKNADLSRVYPILEVEFSGTDKDGFVVVGQPISSNDLAESKKPDGNPGVAKDA